MTAYKKGKKNAFSVFVAIKCNSIFFLTIGITSTGGENVTCCQSRNLHNLTLPTFISEGVSLG